MPGFRGCSNPEAEKGRIACVQLRLRAQGQINTRRRKELRRLESRLGLKTKVGRSKSRGICEEGQNQAETKALAFPGGAGVAQGSPSLQPDPQRVLGCLRPPQLGGGGFSPAAGDTDPNPARPGDANKAACVSLRAGLLNIPSTFRTTLKALKPPPSSPICAYRAIPIPSCKVCSVLVFICFPHARLRIYSPVILTCPLAYLTRGPAP